VSHTPHQPFPAECTHERGVGTTVCLHCRREGRIAVRAKRKRLILRGTKAASVVVGLLAATALSATAIRGRSAARRADGGANPTPAPSTPAPTPKVDTVASRAALVTTTVRTDSAVAAQPVAVAAPTPAPLTPVIPPGGSPLLDGVTAFRADSMVTVSFDIPMVRTRIPEKFERIVRSTLPSIYGSGVDSILAKLPVGAFAQQGDLITDLPWTGARIPVSGAWEIRVYPESRQGRDGPLVVRYRVVMAR
jgi:hypothetical protein